jgi:hypothetical protein
LDDGQRPLAFKNSEEGSMLPRSNGYLAPMQRREEDLWSELGHTLALFGMAVALVLAVLLAGIGL